MMQHILRLEHGWKTPQLWLCEFAHVRMASEQNTNKCSEHPTMLLQNSFPIAIPASIAGKLGLAGLAIFISRIETTEKIRNKVEKWIGCYHLKVAILKSARSDFPIKTEHVQDGIQLNTYMGNYHQTHWFIPRASNTHTHDNVS
jgi:hypothetical protein